MPMLSVKCVHCAMWIPTGLDLDYEAYKDLTYTERTVECPNCDTMQTWNLDDIDRSVFKRPPK